MEDRKSLALRDKVRKQISGETKESNLSAGLRKKSSTIDRENMALGKQIIRVTSSREENFNWVLAGMWA